MHEPSVLDYLKARLALWKYPLPEIPPQSATGQAQAAGMVTQPGQPEQAVRGESLRTDIALVWPWRMLLGIFLTLFAQWLLEPRPERTWTGSLVIYVFAAGLLAWAAWRGEWQPAQPPVNSRSSDTMLVRAPSLLIGLVLAVITFIFSGSNHFSWINLGLLMSSLIFLVHAFWDSSQPAHNDRARRNQIAADSRSMKGFIWPLLLLAVFGLAFFFRFAALDQVPGEMNSDHAEKIYDVLRVLNGQTSIFFPNNGGREGLQIYLVAGLQTLLDLQPGFLPLKIISAAAGFLTLPFIYLLGKEVANPRAGLWAAAFAGVAYWPNVISRLGLRLPFYSLFAAATLYFFLRGLRTSCRNDFILAGLILGLSMYGYSADRILPLVLCAALFVYLLQSSARGQRGQIILFSMLTIVLAGVIFLPMLRYMFDEPQTFLYRTLTRISGAENPLLTPAWLVFLLNTGRAMAMFFWSNGEIWTTSIPYRPALDVPTGALFASGVVLLLTAYLRIRTWQHLFLLISIPLLMLPSILSLAFPQENPNLYRTAGALVPVFLVIGITVDAMTNSLQTNLGSVGRSLAWAGAALLLLVSAIQSYNLVFDRYRQQYANNAWNTSEMGVVIRSFAESLGDINNTWVMGYPHWVDTRLVAINAGYPQRDFAMFTERLDELSDRAGPQLFLIKPEDQAAITALQNRFPSGKLMTYQSNLPNKDFLGFVVPAN